MLPRLLLATGLAHLTNAFAANGSVAGGSWDAWLAPPEIYAAPTSLAAPQQLALGDGDVTVSANQCFGVLAGPGLACEPAPKPLHCDIAPLVGDVTAPGTLLWAPLGPVLCCNTSQVVRIAPGRCAAAVVTVPPEVSPARGVVVGDISQLYHPATQVLVADFLGVVNPYILSALGAACAVAHWIYGYAGRAGAAPGRQSVLDSLRVAYMTSMLATGVHGLFHMVGAGFDRYDILTQAADVAAVAVCTVCFFKEEFMRTVVGDPRIRCLCSRAFWAAGGYAVTGNLGASFSMLQGLLNAVWREGRLPGETRVANVRGITSARP